MIADIYKVGLLTYSKIFQSDNGSEFKAKVTKMLEKHEVRIQRSTIKYKHTHAAFVEALNKILAENLFKVQDVQELNDPNKVSSTWVKHLYGLVDKLNPILPGGGAKYAPLLFFLCHPKNGSRYQAETF